jgi:hypothetical protein
VTRKWLGSLESDNEVVEPGTYMAEVTDARSAETSSGGNMLWLDLRVIGGVDDGQVVSVGVNLPREGEKGLNFAKKKLRGFNPQIVAANIMALPDEEQADAIAAAVLGVKVEAVVSKQSSGPYKGTQQLDETRQVVDVAPAVRAVPAAGATQTVSAATETTVATTASEPLDPPF